MPRRPDDDTTRDVARLYDEYGASLYRYALVLLTDAAAAEDAVHQVFAAVIALTARQSSFDNEEHYLRRAVRNECYSALRRSVRAERSNGDALLRAGSGTDDQPEERLALERALRSLPPEQREVVHLKVYEGMTFQEIADQTDTAMNTVASRYRYALEKLKALLT
jgi:RNA polymerase sigma-70 factor (ECF subfamily)